VKKVRSPLCDDVNDAARLPPEFGVVIGLGDIEFVDRIRPRVQHYIVEILIGDACAIHQEQVMSGPLPQNVDQLTGLLHRQIHHLLIFDDIFDLRRFRLQGAREFSNESAFRFVAPKPSRSSGQSVRLHAATRSPGSPV
jgi:hypothetical protein